ncbi:MAG: DUF1566 domain-containing protein [Nitrospirae bacterium]|nr:DUF1566 domain-containing protein [Nitrospirota bacterium]
MKASRFICLMILAVSLVISPVIAHAGGVISLPKTGQTISYYAGDDGAVQAGVDWPVNRFATSGSMVMDNLTGLQWSQTGNLGGAMTWKDALTYVNNLNSLGYLGYTDWRMPNVKELETLRNYGVTNSATWLNNQGFQDIQGTYWSSTAYLSVYGSTEDTWFVRLDGIGRNFDSRDYAGSLYYILPVRGGQTSSPDPAYPANTPKTGDDACVSGSGSSWTLYDPCSNNGSPAGQDGQLKMGVSWPTNGNSPDGRFTVTGSTIADKTMLDNLTGLMWSADMNTGNKLTWTGALDAIANYNATNYLGYTGWRLANFNELNSLINFNKSWILTQNTDKEPLYNGHWQYLMDQGFIGDPTSPPVKYEEFWTSTTAGREVGRAKTTTSLPWMAVRDASLPVVPEPVSTILFATGGAVFAGRNYLRKRKK